MRTLHGREISSKLCDICASWAPGIQSVWRLLSISLRFTCTWSTIPPQCSVSSWSAPSSARHSGWRSPPPPRFSSAPSAPPRSPRGLLGKCLHKLDELEEVWRIIFYEHRHWHRDILCQLCRLDWLDLCTNFSTRPGNKYKQTLLFTELIESPHNCA